MQQLLADIKTFATNTPSGVNIEITGKNAHVSVFLWKNSIGKLWNLQAEGQTSSLAHV